MGPREFEGRDLDEAIREASAELGIDDDDLHYEIVEHGRKGILGLGAKSVRIRIMPPLEGLTDDELRFETGEGSVAGRPVEPASRGRAGRPTESRPRPAGAVERTDDARGDPGRAIPTGPTESRSSERRKGRRSEAAERASRRTARPAEAPETEPRPMPASAAAGRETHSEEPVAPAVEEAEVVATLERILDLMGLDLAITARSAPGDVTLALEGPDRKVVVQRSAELLHALQFLLNRMARRKWPETRIRLRAEDEPEERGERDEALVETTREIVQQVAETGRSRHTRPLNAYERRLVHLTVRETQGVASRSEGSGSLKRVRISKSRA
jgi:spoIIIJ-associated protein